jgi:hypothetical protein
MPGSALLKVHALPCRHPEYLHGVPHVRWVVLEIKEAEYAEVDGLVDFQQGVVTFYGPPKEVCVFLQQQNLPVPSNIIRDNIKIAGDWEEAVAGDRSRAISGQDGLSRVGNSGVAYAYTGEAIAQDHGFALSEYGNAQTGRRGIAATRGSRSAKAGNLGVAVTYEFGQAEAGIRGVAVVETGGTAEVSNNYAVAVAREGVAIAGNRSCALALPGREALAGDKGLAISWGDMVGAGQAEAGEGGVAIIDAGGTAAAGEGGVILVRYYDGQRYRFAIGYVGEEGIKPGIPYGVDQHGKLVERRSG